MDIRYFLNYRTAFIRQFYSSASAPFLERKRKIEACEEPFIPPNSEDGEPPLLGEWSEAEKSLNVLAYSCVSMLASALHLFLEAWIGQSAVPIDDRLKKAEFKKRGWLSGYNAHFTTRFGIAFENSPVDLRVLEEVVLARNRIEHPTAISDLKTRYSTSDMKKRSIPLFVDETDIALLILSDDEEPRRFMLPAVYVTEGHLLAALAEVEKFGEWFDGEIVKALYGQ